MSALTDQQLLAIALLVTGKVSQKQTAKEVGVAESTIISWMKTTAFQKELAAERRKIRDQRFDVAFSTLSEALAIAAKGITPRPQAD
jgi:transposase